MARTAKVGAGDEGTAGVRASSGPPRAATAATVLAELESLRDPARAHLLQGFFKTGPGEYGEGDRFLGLRVPQVRASARRHRALPLDEVSRLLRSPWHEARLLALVLLVERYRRGDEATRTAIFDLYLANTDRINSWDLVDVSAGHIVGPQLTGRRSALLTRLAGSGSVWERRIAIMATSHLIGKDNFGETLRIARLLLADPHDLIHKAVGWMLREVGKRDREVAERFLRRHAPAMPRTMLRYAIEKFPPALRAHYLALRSPSG